MTVVDEGDTARKVDVPPSTDLHPSPDCYTDHMTRQLTATEAKATLLALLDEVAAGAQVEITKHGHTVARLVPATGPHSLGGRLSDMARTAGTDDELFSTGERWNAS